MVVRLCALGVVGVGIVNCKFADELTLWKGDYSGETCDGSYDKSWSHEEFKNNFWSPDKKKEWTLNLVLKEVQGKKTEKILLGSAGRSWCSKFYTKLSNSNGTGCEDNFRVVAESKVSCVVDGGTECNVRMVNDFLLHVTDIGPNAAKVTLTFHRTFRGKNQEGYSLLCAKRVLGDVPPSSTPEPTTTVSSTDQSDVLSSTSEPTTTTVSTDQNAPSVVPSVGTTNTSNHTAGPALIVGSEYTEDTEDTESTVLSTPAIVLIVSGVLLLVVASVGGFVLFRYWKAKDSGLPPHGNSSPSAASAYQNGWSTVPPPSDMVLSSVPSSPSSEPKMKQNKPLKKKKEASEWLRGQTDQTYKDPKRANKMVALDVVPSRFPTIETTTKSKTPASSPKLYDFKDAPLADFTFYKKRTKKKN